MRSGDEEQGVFEHVLRRIQEAVRTGRFDGARQHFAQKLAEEDLTDVDAEAAILRGLIRRRRTDDPRGVRYEVVGPSTNGRTIGVVFRFQETGIPILITVYVVEEP